MRAFLPMLVLAVLFVSFSFASDGVRILKTKETGTATEHLSSAISYNCPNKVFTVALKDSGSPIQDAPVYLFYGDYSYQLIDTSKTGPDGTVQLQMIGKENLLKGTFTVRMEKPGFKTLEVELVIDCSSSGTQNNSDPVQNQTQNTTPDSNLTQNQTAQNWTSNTSGTQGGNQSNYQNGTQQQGGNQYQNGQQGETEKQGWCMPIFITLALCGFFFLRG